MKKSVRKWLILLLAAVYMGSTGYYVAFRIISARQARRVEALEVYLAIPEETTLSEPEQVRAIPETMPEEPKQLEEIPVSQPETIESPGKNIQRFSALIEKNRNFTAWLTLPGDSSAGFPVMHSPADPDYYLNHSFEGENSFVGVPYLDSRCTTGSNSLMIYGHNMKNGSMFARLLKYDEQWYAEAYPEIQLDTLDENRVYRIIGAFYGGVYYADEEGVFRFYNYAGDLPKEMFEDYVAEVKLASPVQFPETAEYGDELLTLVTCAYQRKNGRFVVVAKRIE